VFLSLRILYAAGPAPVICACMRHSLVEMLAGFPRKLFPLAPLSGVLFFWRMFPLGNGDCFGCRQGEPMGGRVMKLTRKHPKFCHLFTLHQLLMNLDSFIYGSEDEDD